MAKTIDFHAHMLPDAIKQVRGTGKEWFGTLVEDTAQGTPSLVTSGRRSNMGSAAYWERPEARLERMDADGVDVQVVTVAPFMFRYEIPIGDGLPAAQIINDELSSWHERWPDRFLSMATLPLQEVDAALAELERVASLPGMVGVAVATHVDGENWDSPRLRPIVQAIESLSMMLFFHPNHHRAGESLARYHLSNMIGHPLETAIAIASLIFGGVLDQVPDLRALFAHAGGFAPGNVGRFDHGSQVREDSGSSRLPSLYMQELFFDSLRHRGAALRHLIDLVGIDQVVLGTDHPADMGVASPVKWLAAQPELRKPEVEQILSGNAPRLLGRRAGSA